MHVLVQARMSSDSPRGPSLYQICFGIRSLPWIGAAGAADADDAAGAAGAGAGADGAGAGASMGTRRDVDPLRAYKW